MLSRNGEEVPLRPKSYEVLTYLVENHGRMVAKSALIEAVVAGHGSRGQLPGAMFVRNPACLG
jgi:DNA-binding winged helix-turn-helix (wHTH) protein